MGRVVLSHIQSILSVGPEPAYEVNQATTGFIQSSRFISLA